MPARTFLIVTDYLDPERPGGGARVAWETARGLAANGHDCRLAAGLAAPSPPRRDGNLSAAWFRAYPGGGVGVLGYRRIRRDVRETVRAVLDGKRPEVVLLHQPLTAACVEALPELAGVPVLYYFHSPWHREYELNRSGAGGGEGLLHRWRTALGSRLRRSIELRALNRAARVIVLSKYMRGQAMMVHGLPSERLVHIPGGVDPVRFAPGERRAETRRRSGLPESGPLVLTVRRLVPRMGLTALVDGFARLADEFPDAVLGIGGTGPLEQPLRAHIREAGLSERALLLGHVPEEMLPDLLRSADLFVVPSTELEGFGLALVEAMACGAPVLATPVGGMAELLREFNPRCLSASGDPEALAAGMRALLQDPQGRAELGARAACFVRERYAWNRAVRALEELSGALV